MINDAIVSRVTNFLSSEFSKNVGKLAIIKNADGSYEFFDRYSIYEKEGRFYVALLNDDRSSIFSSLKSAVTWCIHDNENKFAKANRIKHLDVLIAGTEVAIEMHKKMLKSSKNEEKTLIHLAKMNEEKQKRAVMLLEMESYIQDSSHIQRKKFKEKR